MAVAALLGGAADVGDDWLAADFAISRLASTLARLVAAGAIRRARGFGFSFSRSSWRFSQGPNTRGSRRTLAVMIRLMPSAALALSETMKLCVEARRWLILPMADSKFLGLSDAAMPQLGRCRDTRAFASASHHDAQKCYQLCAGVAFATT